MTNALGKIFSALFVLCALTALTACGPDSSAQIVVPEGDPAQAPEEDSGVEDLGTGEAKRICNWDHSCCCTRDRSGEIRCYGSCQTP